MFGYLAGLPDTVWHEYLWSKDRLYHKINHEMQKRVSQAAVMAGIKAAEKITAEYTGVSAKDLIETWGGKVEKVPYNPFGHIRPYLFAEFTEPDKIVIYEEYLSKMQRFIDKVKSGGLTAAFSAEQIILAHEFFHLLDYKDKLTKAIDGMELVKFGKISLRSRAAAPSEIAAMAFARELSGISFHPCILDILIVYGDDPARGNRMLNELLAW